MKILFVCKWNRFRSKVAEAYFNKINKNKKIEVESAGLIPGPYPLNKYQVKAAKQLGINMEGKPKSLSTKLLNQQDKIIIIADNIPKSIFNGTWWEEKIVVWKMPDVKSAKDIEGNKRIIKKIIRKVNKLIKKLNNMEGKK